MKSILLSIKPEWVAKILNGEKTIEVRKKFPKGFKGWVYIYVTKGNKKEHLIFKEDKYQVVSSKISHYPYKNVCGKVVARFWCDNVEEIFERVSLCDSWFNEWHFTKTLSNKELCKKSNLTLVQIGDYFNYPKDTLDYVGYAIHISNLQILDRPKELNKFKKYGMTRFLFDHCADNWVDDNWNELLYVSKAPQNYCYVGEVE